ncbi:VNG_1110C family protein [Halobacterium litoreum]|uniref:Uncharacterized protein n=1 Tax=Halobacterium litoreum TaxID=2039234 RepID=A0ABD5NBN0_9EURY|nr:hypothetical protein [Halobacterium litoreum]UHH14624.1 hypothetical protein LT972_06390 [Halobacterium litoreum]
MADPSTFRDSTQIVLPASALEGIREDVEAEFVVTIFEPEDSEVVRIIGSPVVIKEVSEFLTRHGISLP